MTHPGGRPRAVVDKYRFKTLTGGVKGNGRTLRQVANELGISRTTAWRLVHGKHISQVNK